MKLHLFFDMITVKEKCVYNADFKQIYNGNPYVCLYRYIFRSEDHSDFMAASIGTNPVIVRKILQQLKAAGLIEVARGTGGVTITRPLEQITFLDVYKAVECAPDEELLHFHENPNQKCPVGKNIHHVLDKRLLEVQKAMEEKLSEMTLADVKKDIAVYTEEEWPTRRLRMSDYIITISGAFSFFNQCKIFKMSCNKKSYKKFDVTIAITLN